MSSLKFVLDSKSTIQLGKRTEEVMTYLSEDKTQGVQFHAHPTRAFDYVILRHHNVDSKTVNKLVTAYVKAGISQHDFKGGFAEAISVLSV